MNLPLKLTAETLAILMIGDGALALTQPQRHVALWNAGPRPWRAMCSYLEERPVLTMAIGLASIASGFLLASTLRREEEDVYEHLGAEAHVPSHAWQDFDAVVH